MILCIVPPPKKNTWVKGPSIKYVSTFSAIFDPSLPHVSNRQHFKTPLKSMSAFLNPPPYVPTFNAYENSNYMVTLVGF